MDMLKELCFCMRELENGEQVLLYSIDTVSCNSCQTGRFGCLTNTILIDIDTVECGGIEAMDWHAFYCGYGL